MAQSVSTTATADNLPGPGRAIDTYVYQPGGRRLERFAMRIMIRYLDPWRIAAFIGRDGTIYAKVRGSTCTKDLALKTLSLIHCEEKGRNDTAIISGLKSLVRQAQ